MIYVYRNYASWIKVKGRLKLNIFIHDIASHKLILYMWLMYII